MAAAAVAVECDGLIVEVHPDPSKALSDGAQSLTPEVFGGMMVKCRTVAGALGKTLG